MKINFTVKLLNENCMQINHKNKIILKLFYSDLVLQYKLITQNY